MLKTISHCLIASLLACLSFGAHAWGYDGHRISALIATDLLTPTAKAQLGVLLPGVQLADVASYLDDERMALKRQIPGSDKWHYNNIPVCGGGSRDVCRDGNCATARIEQLSKALADKHMDQNTRAFAVKALVHLISDIHQPLHAADDHDHGGNEIQIGSRNLHGEWDSGILKKLVRGQSVDSFARSLSSRNAGRFAGLQNGNAASWADDSHRLAVDVAYGQLPGFACGRQTPNLDKLPSSYYDAAGPVVVDQLVKAGARIAMVLNKALDK